MKTVHRYEGKKQLPIPRVQLPRKVSGFKCIIISFINRNAIAFLNRFRPLFAACPINLVIHTNSDRILGLIMHNIWPILEKNLRGMDLDKEMFRRLRQFVPSILNDCPLLRVVSFSRSDLFTEFPANDNATASDGQAMAKWLFTPLPNNVPKVLRYQLKKDDGNLASRIEAFKAAFASASSPVNFIVVLWFPQSFADSVVLFDLTNELTHEQLTLKRTVFSIRFLLIRSPTGRDESKWAKWEEEAFGWEFLDQWSRIDIEINDEANIGDGLLGATHGPSDQQK
ncbi:hypothetical protein niasHT_035832 [Heterodera trifolii]|uniref:Uncharacterized protein n=1 Tax=Heterodera trifolii TaxID=157864 RepID=A0ABD2IUJ8_9BILA